jgi:aspartate dehydrogenase
LLIERHSNVELIGVGTRTEPVGEAALASNVRWLQKPEALANLKTDMVIEAAGRAAVEPWGLAALRHAGCLVVSSTSAFGEEGLLERLIACAEQHRSQILVPLAAVDALAAASILPLHEVTKSVHAVPNPRMED